LFLVGPCAKAASIPLDGRWIVSGATTMRIASSVGSSSRVQIDLGSGPVPSGPFAFLDPDAISNATFDFTNRVLSVDLHLLVTFPLQTGLGLAPYRST
jgi:hypothetical protein